ncbi:MAG: oligoendopeptidase F [Clostridia bacterium]|nr:oligoendopeptidase F [Clostridia bacterium]
MKKRSEIEDKYKWDLSSYVKDEQELEQNLQYLKDNAERYKDFYGKFGDKNTLKQYLKFDEKYTIKFYKTSAYIGHTLNTDMSNTKYINFSKQLEFIAKQCGEAGSYISPQLNELSNDYLNELLKDEDLVDYKLFFANILRNKPHKISEQDSKLLSKMSLCLGNDGEVFDTLTSGEIKFDDIIDSNGNKHEVYEADYSKWLQNEDRNLRKQAFSSIMNGYGGKIRTLACLYTNDIQYDIFDNDLTKFASTREKSMFHEDVDIKVYDVLIRNINNRIDILQNILKLKSKYLNINDMAYYDMMLNVGSKSNFDIGQAQKLIKQCTKILGNEYQQILNEKFNQKVIDYLPNENKQTGAYSSGVYGCPSIVFMNFVEDYNSVSTLAHEIGHAMHTEFSDRNQPLPLSNYVIFVAEVASTVNEILLNLHVQNISNENQKISLIFELLDSLRATVYRQTLFSEFEDFAHNKLEAGKPLTYEDYNNKYYELNKKYYGDSVMLPEDLKYEWSRIPHFYNAFYVYKYATGFISALCIVQNLLEDVEYYKKYINFLKSGCSKPPVELLQDIGVDLTCDEPYIKAFRFVENLINKINI